MAIVYEIQMGRETYQPQNHTTGPADLFNIIERQKRLEQALKNEWRNP